jgi:hypothetical protein
MHSNSHRQACIHTYESLSILCIYFLRAQLVSPASLSFSGLSQRWVNVPLRHRMKGRTMLQPTTHSTK